MPKIKFNLPTFDPAATASKLPEPLQWIGGAALGGLNEIGKFIGGDTPETQLSASLGAPMMAAGESELTPIARKAGDVLSKLYSRVGRAAESLPALSHPNKIASVLKNQANPEEVNFRGLGDFLKGKGNQMVPKEEILGHLEKNPAPEINLTTRDNELSPIGHGVEGRILKADRETKYHSYQLPGGENYRENIFTLPSKTTLKPSGDYKSTVMFPESSVKDLDASGTLEHGVSYFPLSDEQPPNPGIYQTTNTFGGSKGYGEDYAKRYGGIVTNTEPEMVADETANYRGPHFDEPNYFLHSRTQDRYLNSPINLPHDYDDAVNEAIEALPLGASNEEVQNYLNQSGKGTGPKIRNIENIQSDWHQQGAKEGYGPQSVNPEDAEMFRRATEDREAAYNHLQGLRDQYSGMDPTDFYSHPTAQRDLEEAGRAFDNANNVYHSAAAILPNPKGVPDAPFKNSWLDLGLKHQILDVAHDPNLEGISVTPGSEMMSRGEGHSPQFNDIQIPNALKRLLKPFGGGEPEMKMIGELPKPGVAYHYVPEENATGIFTQGQIGSLWPRNSPNNLIEPNRIEPYIASPKINAPYFQITPEMKAQIKAKGLPLMAIMGLIGSQQNQEEQ